MKANVQISAVKKEFKNGQQGWQVFVDGMEGRLRCEMNFHNSLKAIRYCFLLSKRLDLQINDIQLTALSLDYQQSKSAAEQAKVAEDATQVAQEVAGEAGAEPEEAPAPEEQVESAPESEELVRTPNNVLISQYEELKRKHPDALLLFRCGDFYECYDEHAEKAADCLGITLTARHSTGRKIAGFPYHALDSYLPKLIRAGHRIAICDQLEAPKGKAKVVEDIKPAPKKRSKKQAQQEELFTEA